MLSYGITACKAAINGCSLSCTVRYYPLGCTSCCSIVDTGSVTLRRLFTVRLPVQDGDTIDSFAAATGLPREALVKANGGAQCPCATCSFHATPGQPPYDFLVRQRRNRHGNVYITRESWECLRELRAACHVHSNSCDVQAHSCRRQWATRCCSVLPGRLPRDGDCVMSPKTCDAVAINFVDRVLPSLMLGEEITLMIVLERSLYAIWESHISF